MTHRFYYFVSLCMSMPQKIHWRKKLGDLTCKRHVVTQEIAQHFCGCICKFCVPVIVDRQRDFISILRKESPQNWEMHLQNWQNYQAHSILFLGYIARIQLEFIIHGSIGLQSSLPMVDKHPYILWCQEWSIIFYLPPNPPTLSFHSSCFTLSQMSFLPVHFLSI